MHGNSRSVTSNQSDIHPDLDTVVNKHLNSVYQRPVSASSKRLFAELYDQVNQYDANIIIDAGCGTAESAYHLAASYPSHTVIGIDKSTHRLTKKTGTQPFFMQNNLILIQIDLVSFWLLAKDHKLPVSHQYFLYPNPWPKQQHLQRRWYGHAIWPSILALGGQLICRSNWLLYLREFQRALSLSGKIAEVSQLSNNEPPVTAFQKKYTESGQNIYGLNCQL